MANLKQTPADEARDRRLWEAVLHREPIRHERFVYAVHTTGIFCRPTCPSRRPLRKNVSFFETPADARRAGFRACKRCHPMEVPPEDETQQKVIAACRYIQDNPDRIPTLSELGGHVGFSPTHLQRVFKRVIGVSPRHYADALRVERLKSELRAGESIAGALYGSGYSSTSRLYEKARSKLGMTPSAYSQGASGERIRYVTVDSPVGGILLVAATERGVCAVRLGESPRELIAELESEFAGASFERGGDDRLCEWLETLTNYLAGGDGLPELPQDIRATAFQRRVWDAIRDIPIGSTATYGELAEKIGKPTAVRAVASACAKNPVALVVPCHRVVPKSGGTGRYRWGDERKRALLEIEKRRD